MAQEGSGVAISAGIKGLDQTISFHGEPMHDVSHAHAAHHAPTSFIGKYVFSLDHKVIGKQYYGLAFIAVLFGMFLSWLMRLHLGWTNLPIPGLHLLSANGAPGDVMTPEFYLQLMTMHGTIMVFLY